MKVWILYALDVGYPEDVPNEDFKIMEGELDEQRVVCSQRGVKRK